MRLGHEVHTAPLRLLRSDAEGGFASFSKDMRESRADEAVPGTFVPVKTAQLHPIKDEPIELAEHLRLMKLLISLKKGCLERNCYFSVKIYRLLNRFTFIVSTSGTEKRLLGLTLQRSLSELADHRFHVRSPHMGTDYISKE